MASTNHRSAEIIVSSEINRHIDESRNSTSSRAYLLSVVLSTMTVPIPGFFQHNVSILAILLNIRSKRVSNIPYILHILCKKSLFRQRYVPINHRIQDLCYDFLPEHRMNSGYKSCLPDDAQEIYEPFGTDLTLIVMKQSS